MPSKKQPQSGSNLVLDTRTELSQTLARWRGSTPINSSASSIWGDNRQRNTEERLNLMAEMEGKWVQMDVKSFQKHFYPGKVDLSKAMRAELERRLRELPEEAFKTPEINTYSHLISALQPALDGEKYVLRDTNHRSTTTEETQMFDFAIYKKSGPNDPETGCHEITESERESSRAKPERKPHLARCCPRHVIVPFEVKMAEDNNPFGKKIDQPLLSRSRDGNLARGQLAEQIGFIQRFQHRTFIFSVLIYRRTARIIRWDRAGAIVTEPFDYTENPDILVTFLHRISRMSNKQLGYDTTIIPAEDRKVSELRQYNCPTHLKGLFDEAFPANSRSFVIQQVTIAKQAFLIGDLHYGTWSPTGRGTKVYLAYNLTEKRLCYIKENWRNPKGHPEHETYRALQEAQVQNIATCIAGEDVSGPEHSTDTQNHFEDETRKHLSIRIHHRMALREVGLPLTGYKDSAELCVVVCDAFSAHLQAWNAGVLHRDISDTNIVIYLRDDGSVSGLLLDWDLCKYREELKQKQVTAVSRSGTLPFMSALRIMYPMHKRASLSDDLESFLHLLTYLAMRFHRSELSMIAKPRTRIHRLYYDLEHDEQGIARNKGVEKYELIKFKSLGMARLEDSLGFASLIDNLLDLCSRHYRAMGPQIKKWAAMKKEEEDALEGDEDADRAPALHEESEVEGIDKDILGEIKQEDLVLNNHDKMYDYFCRAAQSARQARTQGANHDPNWPLNDKEDDHLQKPKAKAKAKPGIKETIAKKQGGSASQGSKIGTEG